MPIFTPNTEENNGIFHTKYRETKLEFFKPNKEENSGIFHS